MPYQIVPSEKATKFYVQNKITGQNMSKKLISLEKAKKQLIALYINVSEKEEKISPFHNIKK